MAGSRPIVLALGGGVAIAGLILLTLRLVGAASGIPGLGQMDPVAFYGLSAAIMVVGAIVLLAAPESTRRRRHVRLDEAPVEAHMTLRPGRSDASDTGSASAAPQETSRPPDVKPHAEAAAAPTGAPTTPRTTGIPAAEVRAERGNHPNDPRYQGNNGHAASGAAAPGPVLNDPEADAREESAQARRHELMERLEALEQKANQAKVRFGLGKVSAAGYRQYLAEVDRERMMIESELMENEV